MKLLRRFLALSWAERFLFLRCTVLLLFTAAALRVFHFERLYRRMYVHPGASSGLPQQTITWAVEACASRLPATTCLVRALVAERLLRQHGHAAHLRIGVTTRQRFAAHAWVEIAGVAVLGQAEDLSRFVQLPSFSSARPSRG